MNNEEQLKQKAKDFVSKIASGTPKEMDYYADILTEFATEATKELEAQIEKMKAELHHRLVSPSHDDSDCLDKIIGLDRLWQFGQEF